MNINSFGVQLKYYLEKHRINKAALARDLGITPQSLQSMFKTPNTGIQTIERVLKILNVSKEQFYESETVSNEDISKNTIELKIEDYNYLMNALRERDELKNKEIERLKEANRATQPENH